MGPNEPPYGVVEVNIGEFYEDGTFDGEIEPFLGREVQSWEGMRDSIDRDDQFGVTLRLYECPLELRGVGYRVYEFVWSLSPSRSSEGALYPPALDAGYALYSRKQVQEQWGNYFSLEGDGDA